MVNGPALVVVVRRPSVAATRTQACVVLVSAVVWIV